MVFLLLLSRGTAPAVGPAVWALSRESKLSLQPHGSSRRLFRHCGLRWRRAWKVPRGQTGGRQEWLFVYDGNGVELASP